MAPTFRHSKGTVVVVNQTDLSCVLQNVEWDSSLDTAEVTTLCQSDRAYLAGVREASVTMDGFYDASAEDANALFDSALGSTSLPVVSICLPNATTGGYARLGQVHATAHQVSSPFSGAVTSMASFQANDFWAHGHVLAPLAARSAATTHASVDSKKSTGTSVGGIGHLHVTAATTRSGSTAAELRMVIQDSSNASAWADYITFANVASTDPTTWQRVTSTATLERHVRARSPGQSSTNCTYLVTFARRR